MGVVRVLSQFSTRGKARSARARRYASKHTKEQGDDPCKREKASKASESKVVCNS